MISKDNVAKCREKVHHYFDKKDWGLDEFEKLHKDVLQPIGFKSNKHIIEIIIYFEELTQDKSLSREIYFSNEKGETIRKKLFHIYEKHD